MAIFDPDVADGYPDWADGDVEFATSDWGVALATIPDTRGSVLIRVVSGELPSLDARIIFAGTICASAGRFLVGSVTGSELFEVRLSAGQHPIRIESTSAIDEVDQVIICLD